MAVHILVNIHLICCHRTEKHLKIFLNAERLLWVARFIIARIVKSMSTVTIHAVIEAVQSVKTIKLILGWKRTRNFFCQLIILW